MNRALITGITGFVGSHLAEYLLTKGVEVYGTSQWGSKQDNIEHIRGDINLISADLKDGNSLEKAVKKSKPDFIFHLAAQSIPIMSSLAPVDTIETNVIGTINLLEAINKIKMDAKIQVAGSSDEYGMVYPKELPIQETNPLRPLSAYGVSKVAQEQLSTLYHQSYGLKTVVTRAFNHTGPRRGEVFATSNFAKQIAEIERGKEPVIYVGNLHAQRDFTDVRDMVRAYWLAVQKCEFGEVYNVCSTQAIKIEDVLNLLLSMSSKKIEVKKDSSRMRLADVEILRGDCSKFKKKTGWKPAIPFEKTMEDLLNYWRERV